MEKVNQESIHDGPEEVKGGHKVLDQGTEDWRIDRG
jgi:hypothetical protein